MASLTGAGAVADLADYRRRLRRAGIDEDEPLHDVLASAVALCGAAEASVRAGAQVLSSDAEAALVDRAAWAVASVAERMVAERTARVARRTGAAVAVLLVASVAAAGAGGWWVGARAAAEERRVAALWCGAPPWLDKVAPRR